MSAWPQVVAPVESVLSEDGVVTDEQKQTRLRELVEEHFPHVWRFLRHLGIPAHSVDDATQEVFLVAARRVEEILPGRERSFLFGTAYKVAQSERRKLGRVVADEDVVEAEVDPSPTPEEHLDDKQACALALRLLDELDEGMRQVFVLYEIEEMTMQQISEMTSLPIGTVASRLRRAREAFQARFERHRNSLRGAK